MSDPEGSAALPTASAPGLSGNVGDDCSLSVRQQWQNIFCYAAFWCIVYLSAPVSYVGLTHGNLLKALGNNDKISNLPSAFYMWLSIVPVLTSWFLPQAKFVKPLALSAVGAMIVMTTIVGLVLLTGQSSGLATIAVIAHGAVWGGANGVLTSAIWDLLRRGVSSSRRGMALGAAFGIGPICACVGALLQDAVFDGQLLGGWNFGLEFPRNYMAMFLAVAPLLLGLGVCIGLFRVPSVAGGMDAKRTAGHEIAEGTREFFRNRALLFAVLIYVLVYSGGNAIFTNVSLHASEVLPSESGTLGAQNFLRFGCKAVTGLLLGWLLVAASPRATLLATTGILLFGMVWALSTTGYLFMATFGILGAGELFGAYYPNYVTTASRKQFVRLNSAYLSALSVLIGFSSLLFGAISDKFGRMASFATSAFMLGTAILLVLWLLPKNPAPELEPSEV